MRALLEPSLGRIKFRLFLSFILTMMRSISPLKKSGCYRLVKNDDMQGATNLEE